MPVQDKTSLSSAALSLVLWSTWVYFRSDMRQPDKQNELLTAFLSLACGMKEGTFFCGLHCCAGCVEGRWESPGLIAFKRLPVMPRTPWTLSSKH